jgi:ribosomal protein S18 acetylase RimI-like enzyme
MREAMLLSQFVRARLIQALGGSPSLQGKLTNDMQLNVRRYERRDAALGVELVKSFADEDVSLDYMERFLSNPLNHLIVAQVDGNVAGFLLAHSLERLKQDSYKMFIYEIDVSEKYRRKGVGTALISYVREIVRKERMLNAFVFTNYSNKGAVEFYKSTGAKMENGDDLMFVYES